jgi:hypothetical protein
LPQFPPQIPSCSPPSVSRPSTVPMRRSAWPNIGARIRLRAGTGFTSEPARAKPGVMVGCPGWICPLRLVIGPRKGKPGIDGGEWVGCAAGSARFGWDLGSREGKTGTYGGEWWVARLDLPASAGFRGLKRQNRVVWRFLVLWRLIFAAGSGSGALMVEECRFPALFLHGTSIQGFRAPPDRPERPREPITHQFPPSMPGFDFCDQNPTPAATCASLFATV